MTRIVGECIIGHDEKKDWHGMEACSNHQGASLCQSKAFGFDLRT
jgi:hypothetical protein